jgi:MFS family permease
MGWSSYAIGITGSAYFLGFIAGCATIPALVYRVGHIRVHTVMASVATAALLLIYLTESLIVWILLRFLTGCAFAGLYMVIESWLNSQILAEDRGFVLSMYTLVSLVAIATGQFLIGLGPPVAAGLFVIGATLLCLSIVPIGLTRLPSPQPISPVDFKLIKLWQRSHVAVVGIFLGGLISGSYWALGPVYASGLGIDASGVGIFMASVVIGGALIILPLGKISDNLDRRRVIMALAIFGSSVCVIASVLIRQDVANLVYVGPFFGMALMPLYSLCLAHANDHVESSEFVQSASAILMISSIGSILGPLILAPLMPLLGDGSLFDCSAIGFLLLAAWCVYRMQILAPQDDDNEAFVAVTRTTAVAAEIDPRSD